VTEAAQQQERDLPHTSNFAPGQVCVVVCADVIVDNTRLYLDVRDWLESELTQQIRGVSSVADPFRVELSLDGLHLPSGSVHWLEMFSPHGLDPWVVLPPVFDDHRYRALLFYQVLLVSDDDKDTDAPVRRLVNVLNTTLMDKQVPDSSVVMCGATPNWYTVAASNHSCGGPGGKPEPVPINGNWRFVLPEQARAWQVAAQAAPGPVVVVLDTCPEPDSLSAAAGSVLANNRLWQQIIQPPGALIVDDPPILGVEAATPDASPIHPGPVLPNWYGPERDVPTVPYSEFEVQDHGLFVAGIIRDIAPQAIVHLVRVLGRYGVGDLVGLSHVVPELTTRFVGASRVPLIVNMSLVVDLPPSDRLLARWFPRAYQNWEPGKPDDRKPQLDDTLQAALDALDSSVRTLIELLTVQGVLVVAAAGNDAVPTTPPTAGPAPTFVRPDPRVPARYKTVFSVGALQKATVGPADAAADYSNRATVGPPAAPLDNGIAVLGGNADLNGTWTPAPPINPPVPGPSIPPAAPGAWYGPRQIDMAAATAVPERVNGVVGLFTASRFPLASIRNLSGYAPPLPNPYGWAYWIGTSFATPIISAIAANLWPTMASGSTAMDVRVMIQANAPLDVTSTLGCHGMEVVQI
jgi:hypothetical protein